MAGKGLFQQVSWAPVELAETPLGFEKILFVAESGNIQLPLYQKQLETEGYASAVISDASQLGPFIGENIAVVHLPSPAKTAEAVFSAATNACNSLVSIAQTLSGFRRNIQDASFRLFSVVPPDTGIGSLSNSTLYGLSRVLRLEIPQIFQGLFEDDTGAFPTQSLQLAQGFDCVRVVKGVPHSAAFQAFSSNCIKPAQKKVNSSASYLVTGGTRGVGLEIATFLSEQKASNIVLVSRNGRNYRPYEKSQGEFTTRIAQMEASGSKVHVVEVDVGKEDAAGKLAVAIKELNIPPVKGVVHAAGLAEYNTLNKCPPESMATVLAPKIIGTLALDQVFPPGTLDFFILTSSVGQLVGFPGQLTYGPANSFLDQFAAYRRRQGDNTISIQWTSWRGLGMLAQNEAAARMITKGMTARGFVDESKEDLLSALETIISSVDSSEIAVMRALELEADEPVRHPMLKYITPRKKAVVQASLSEYPENAIAIVGMSVRTAAGETADDLWRTISAGKSMVREVDEKRFPDIKSYKGKMYGNFMENVDAFDHQFFKKTKREAAALDPHQRVLLEAVYHALESAGEFGGGQDRVFEDHEDDGQVTGCFVGMNAPDYVVNLACHPSSPYTGFGMLRGFVCGRLSHHFGWTGPSHVIDTACSSAMVAVHQACRAIQLGECNRAVAAGINLITNTALYHALRTGGFLNPDGPCKTFDAAAAGYCRGESVGVVILKPLKDALRDNDNIMGVILASGNNQNINNTSITNPVSESQSALYRDVLSRAGIDPHVVSYVEAHGTGTRAGDPVEVKSIRTVLGGKDRRSILHVGAVKPNIGHSEGASGIISLIKVLLMLKHGKITPQANFKTLNPNIAPLEPDNMAISTSLKEWRDQLRVALVNSYGASGNNAAAVVAPAPSAQASTATRNTSLTPPKTWPVFISAGSTASLERYIAKLKDQISAASSFDYVLHLGFALATKQNRRLQQIFTSTVSSLDDLRSQLSDASKYISTATKDVRPVVLLFSGQNGNTVEPAKALYHSSALFRKHIRLCNDAIEARGLPSIIPYILEGVSGDADLVIRHATMFSIQYASGMAWIESGVKPQALCGHSFGEWAALTVSGALTLEAGIKLVTGRAEIIKKLWGDDTGSMCAIEDRFAESRVTPEEYLEPFRLKHPDAKLDVACHNGPNNYVMAGPTADVNLLESWLKEKKTSNSALRFKVLRGMHAYHSVMADPIIEESGRLSASIPFQAPKLAFESCHKDSWTGPGENVVARNTRGPVYFSQALNRIVDRLGPSLFLEAGVGGPIIAMARNALSEQGVRNEFIAVSNKDPVRSLAEATTALWKSGQSDVQFWHFHRSQRVSYKPVDLPQYQFERVSHWLEYTPFGEQAHKSGAVAPAPELLPGTPIPYIAIEKASSESAGQNIFHIDPRSQRYQDLIGGHLVVGSPICPAGMYLEWVTHAVTMLPEVQRMYAVPEIGVDHMANRAPLGLDELRSIRLILRRMSAGSWDFEFRSTKMGTTLTHSLGSISLLSKNDRVDLGEQDKWNRMLRLKEDPDAEALRGSMVYKIFTSMCNYSEPFKGLKSLIGKDGEGAGEIFMSSTAMESVVAAPNPDIIDVLTVDNFMQVPGAFVHSLRPTVNVGEDGATAYVCTGIGAVRPLNGFQGCGRYRAYTKVVAENNKEVQVDAFAFDEDTRKIIWSVRNATFTKIPRATLAKALAAANPDIDFVAPATVTTGSQPRAKLEAQVAEPVAMKSMLKNSAPRPKTVDVFGAVQTLLSESLGVPIATVTRNADLEELGLDSLVSAEVLSKISDQFKADLTPSHLSKATDVASLCDMLSSQCKAGRSAASEKPRPGRKAIAAPGQKQTSGVDVLDGVREILSRSLDVPAETVTLDATLESLGADSLVSSEILSRITDKFRMEISVGDFSAVEDVKSLVAVISAQVGGSSVEAGSTSAPIAKQSGDLDILAGVKGILARSLDVPAETITPEAKLEDLGADSLVSSEILSRITDKFHMEISVSDFSAVEDVKGLVAIIGGSAIEAVTEEDNEGAVVDNEASAYILDKVIEVLSHSLHLPAEEISVDASLDALGVDSLVSVEIASGLNDVFGANVSVDDLASAESVEQLCKLFGGDISSLQLSAASNNASSTRRTSSLATPNTGASTPPEVESSFPASGEKLTVHKAFQSIRRNFDSYIERTNLTGYLEDVYPQHVEIVAAFIVEAFEVLGCPIKDFKAGQRLPSLPETLPMYHREVPRLWDVLEEAGVAERRGQHYFRGTAPIVSEIRGRPASELSKELIAKYPVFNSAHALSDRLGPHLAGSLVGKADPISLLFGSEDGRAEMVDFYANGPGIHACHEVLRDFITATVLNKAQDGEPFRVLEVGAGAGGTTRHVVPLLQELGIPFKYTFTELSGSLLARARNTTFKGIPEMDFRKLDIEKEPPAELAGLYHLIVSSNCVHATRDLGISLSNIRTLLRPEDGCLALVELTQKLAWYELVWGLLEGWWLFNDGRTYALQSPWAWEKVMRSAGFAHVDWSESSSRESRAVRVVAAFTGEADKGVVVKAKSVLIHRGEPSPKHRNLFLLPDGFGSGAVFRGLAPSLSDVKNVSVHALSSPFLGKKYDARNPPSTEELAGIYVAEIKRKQQHGPYLLGGYSFGGIVAYEAARQLMEDGDEVEQLVFMDVASPVIGNSLPIELVDFLDEITKDDARKVGQGDSINSPHFNLARHQLASYRWSKLPGRKVPETVLFSAMSGADKQSAVPRPRVRANEQALTDWFLDDRADGPLGWDTLLGGKVRVFQIPGNHFSTMTSPYIDTWAPELAKMLGEG